MSMKILETIKKCFFLVIIQLSQNNMIYDNSNKLVIGKIKDETGGVAIEEFIGLKPCMCPFLVGNNEHKKAKCVNKNVVGTSHNEFKDVLLNKKCLRHSMKDYKSKD